MNPESYKYEMMVVLIAVMKWVIFTANFMEISAYLSFYTSLAYSTLMAYSTLLQVSYLVLLLTEVFLKKSSFISYTEPSSVLDREFRRTDNQKSLPLNAEMRKGRSAQKEALDHL